MPKSRVEWKINGRKVAPGQVGKALEKAFSPKIATVAKEQVEQHIRDVRCPVHGGGPQRVSVTGPEALDTTWRLSAKYCCDEQQSIAEAALGGS